MKYGIKKSTLAEVQKMTELYQDGVSYTEIGRRFNKHHTTIMYWIRKYIKEGKIEVHKKEPVIPVMRIDRRGGYRRVPGRMLEKDVCQWCGKKQGEFNPKWRITHFCCLKHWDYQMTGVKNILL